MSFRQHALKVAPASRAGGVKPGNGEGVVCNTAGIGSAHSDYGWEQIKAKLGATERLYLLMKAFNPEEVRDLVAVRKDLARPLTDKWLNPQQNRK